MAVVSWSSRIARSSPGLWHLVKHRQISLLKIQAVWKDQKWLYQKIEVFRIQSSCGKFLFSSEHWKHLEQFFQNLKVKVIQNWKSGFLSLIAYWLVCLWFTISSLQTFLIICQWKVCENLLLQYREAPYSRKTGSLDFLTSKMSKAIVFVVPRLKFGPI